MQPCKVPCLYARGWSLDSCLDVWMLVLTLRCLADTHVHSYGFAFKTTCHPSTDSHVSVYTYINTYACICIHTHINIHRVSFRMWQRNARLLGRVWRHWTQTVLYSRLADRSRNYIKVHTLHLSTVNAQNGRMFDKIDALNCAIIHAWNACL